MVCLTIMLLLSFYGPSAASPSTRCPKDRRQIVVSEQYRCTERTCLIETQLYTRLRSLCLQTRSSWFMTDAASAMQRITAGLLSPSEMIYGWGRWIRSQNRLCLRLRRALEVPHQDFVKFLNHRDHRSRLSLRGAKRHRLPGQHNQKYSALQKCSPPDFTLDISQKTRTTEDVGSKHTTLAHSWRSQHDGRS